MSLLDPFADDPDRTTRRETFARPMAHWCAWCERYTPTPCQAPWHTPVTR